jgi:hypothetical protein
MVVRRNSPAARREWDADRTARTDADPAPALPAYPAQTTATRRATALPVPREEWRCYSCGQKVHLARHGPGARDVSMHTASLSDRRGGACLRTTCWSHEWTVSPSLPIRGGRHDTHALLDSGSVVDVVEVGCIHGKVETYPTSRIAVQTPKGTITVQARVVPNLPMSLLIGRDCPIFWETARGRTPPISTPTPKGETAAHAPLSHTDSDESPERERETRESGGTPASHLVHGVCSPRHVGHDDRLRSDTPARRKRELAPHWVLGLPPRSREIGRWLPEERLETRADPQGTIKGLGGRQYPHFSTRGGVVYRVQRRGEEKEQLVVPRTYVSKLLYMAHSHLGELICGWIRPGTGYWTGSTGLG